MARLKTDWILFLTILAMTGFGIVMVYSASSAVAEALLQRRAVLLRRAPDRLRADLLHRADVFQAPGLPRAEHARVGLLRPGNRAESADRGVLRRPKTHRWFRVPGIGSLQPSEFAKPALILFLAYFISRRAQAINHRKTLQQAFVAVAMLAMLVVVADLGTAMVPVITAVIVFWVAGLEWKYMRRVALRGPAAVRGLRCAGAVTGWGASSPMSIRTTPRSK